jgi:hypothetical protein
MGDTRSSKWPDIRDGLKQPATAEVGGSFRIPACTIVDEIEKMLQCLGRLIIDCFKGIILMKEEARQCYRTYVRTCRLSQEGVTTDPEIQSRNTAQASTACIHLRRRLRVSATELSAGSLT